MRTVVFIATLLSCAPALAQRSGEQRCGLRTASYGPIEVGTIVVPQRHRYVGGEPNWEPRMGRFLGRVARVTRLSGLDARGCAGVRLDVDGGEFFWRVRDLDVGPEPPRSVLPRRDQIPEACRGARYGPLRVGARVMLGRHRPVAGHDNWSAAMGAYVGREARIVELMGADDQGCPGVHVDADGGEWFWRIRDLSPVEQGGPVVYATGLGGDHGRDLDGDVIVRAGEDGRLPQACGLTDATAVYGPVGVGAEVVLGRHREVDGETNWVDEMDNYVGRRARVIALIGVDDQGCPLVAVDVDQGDWFWRLRDLRLP